MKNNIFKYFDNIIMSKSLNENKTNSYKKISDEKELINLFKEDYSEALQQYKKGKIIYRGAKKYLTKNDLAVIVTPGIRISQANVPNIYTILLSELFDSWKKFPKRNRSHICSLSLISAQEFSDTIYFVFPKNGTKIGVCPRNDIWYSFNTKYNKSSDTLSYMILFIFSLILNYDIDKIKEDFKNSYKTANLFKEFDNVIDNASKNKRQKYLNVFNKNYYSNSLFSDFIKFVEINKKSNFLKFLEENVFNSKDFKIVNVSDLSTIIDNYKEVWFEGDAIYMPIEDMYFEWIRDNV